MTDMNERRAAQTRVKKAWERIFNLHANKQPVPTGSRPSTDADREELRAALIVAALAFDELYETGQLRPDLQGRIVESMRNLLLVLDSLAPLPEGLVPSADLEEVVSAIRTARGTSTL